MKNWKMFFVLFKEGSVAGFVVESIRFICLMMYDLVLEDVVFWILVDDELRVLKFMICWSFLYVLIKSMFVFLCVARLFSWFFAILVLMSLSKFFICEWIWLVLNVFLLFLWICNSFNSFVDCLCSDLSYFIVWECLFKFSDMRLTRDLSNFINCIRFLVLIILRI